MSKIVILGAGIAGHTAAAHLRRKLSHEHEVLVISPNRNYQWVPRGDRGAIKTRLADDDELSVTWFVPAPRPVEMLAEAAPDALYQKPHRLVGNRKKSFHPQHIVLLGIRAELGYKLLRISERADMDDETFEFVVVMLRLVIVMRLARFDIVLGRRFQAEQQFGIDTAFACQDDLDRARQESPDLTRAPVPFRQQTTSHFC